MNRTELLKKLQARLEEHPGPVYTLSQQEMDGVIASLSDALHRRRISVEVGDLQDIVHKLVELIGEEPV